MYHAICSRFSPFARGVRSVTPRSSLRSPRSRGFTLIELLVVVAMVGILSALAVEGVGRYFNSARVVDAKGAVSAIKQAQEIYKAKYGVYANVSPNRDDDWYPGDPLAGNVIYAWKLDHPLYFGSAGRPGWSDLDVPLKTFTGGGCTTQAGVAGQAVTGGADTIAGLKLSYDPDQDWYVVVCATDFDEDGVIARFGGSSLFSEVVVEDPSVH